MYRLIQCRYKIPKIEDVEASKGDHLALTSRRSHHQCRATVGRCSVNRRPALSGEISNDLEMTFLGSLHQCLDPAYGWMGDTRNETIAQNIIHIHRGSENMHI